MTTVNVEFKKDIKNDSFRVDYPPNSNVKIVYSPPTTAGMYPHDSGNPQDDLWYENMRKRFDDRKSKWEQDVQRMRHDFFANSAHQGPPVYVHGPKFPADKPPVETCYIRDSKDNKMHYIAKFFMPNIEAKNVNVSVKDKSLNITGKREFNNSGSTHMSEFQRSITLPNGIQQDKISATLTSDNVLIVDCHVDNFDPQDAGFESGFHDSCSNMKNSQQFSKEYQNPVQINHPPVIDSFGVIRGSNFELKIPIGTYYAPDEIQIRLMGNRLYINAMHQERTPNGSSFREFSKEYDVPVHINADMIQAHIVNGVLLITTS